jgi:hypothetical protein
MANTATQFGFRHIGYLSGGAPDYQLATRNIQSSYATAIFFGDPVVKTATTGYIIPDILGSGNLTAIEGIFYGCTYVPAGGGAPVWSPAFPGSTKTDATAYVMNAPNALFVAAAYSASFTAGNIGANAGYTAASFTGSLTGGMLSIFTMNQSTLTTGVGAMQVVDLWSNRGIGNGADSTTNFGWVVVTFANQRYRQTTGVL